MSNIIPTMCYFLEVHLFHSSNKLLLNTMSVGDLLGGSAAILPIDAKS